MKFHGSCQINLRLRENVNFKVRLCHNQKRGTSLDSGIDVGHGKFDKKNKHRVLNKLRAWIIWQKSEVFCNEKIVENYFFNF